MIISASRRTDIPSYYSDWFYNRIKEGFVLVRNPMNYRQVSKINLAPDVVDGIVFWTKNPLPMLGRLGELADYMYYFQFTITPYGRDIEPKLPSKGGDILSAFKRLSDAIGADRVIWRYDPILISKKYSPEYHVKAFAQMAAELHNYTRRVTISFIDVSYRNIKRNLEKLALLDFPPAAQREIAGQLADIAHSHGLAIDTCAEKMELQQFGIGQARCIDNQLLGRLLGCRLNVDKDKHQRMECGCAASIDIGMYNSCSNGCRYCYANDSHSAVSTNFTKHDQHSALISGAVDESDRVSERAVKSCRDAQRRLF